MDKDEYIKKLEHDNELLRKQLVLLVNIIEKTLIEIGKVRPNEE